MQELVPIQRQANDIRNHQRILPQDQLQVDQPRSVLLLHIEARALIILHHVLVRLVLVLIPHRAQLTELIRLQKNPHHLEVHTLLQEVLLRAVHLIRHHDLHRHRAVHPILLQEVHRQVDLHTPLREVLRQVRVVHLQAQALAQVLVRRAQVVVHDDSLYASLFLIY